MNLNNSGKKHQVFPIPHEVKRLAKDRTHEFFNSHAARTILKSHSISVYVPLNMGRLPRDLLWNFSYWCLDMNGLHKTAHMNFSTHMLLERF